MRDARGAIGEDPLFACGSALRGAKRCGRTMRAATVTNRWRRCPQRPNSQIGLDGALRASAAVTAPLREGNFAHQRPQSLVHDGGSSSGRPKNGFDRRRRGRRAITRKSGSMVHSAVLPSRRWREARAHPPARAAKVSARAISDSGRSTVRCRRALPSDR
jgi:hypothetical protein